MNQSLLFLLREASHVILFSFQECATLNTVQLRKEDIIHANQQIH